MKKIGIVTATRAEWGLLRPLAKQIKSTNGFKLILYVTGTHFCTEHGNTFREILADGFEIDERVDMLLYPQSPSAISKTMALTITGFAELFSRQKPDLLILLGDRYETLAVAVAAVNEGIPIAHLYGGEVTEGAIDEVFRHAITKLSSLHLTSCENYRKRIIQMGEQPDRVFTVGSLAVDNIRQMKLLEAPELSEKIGFPLTDAPYGVVTFHPVTKEPGFAIRQLEELLKVIDRMKDFKFLITKSNADYEADHINRRLDEFGKKNRRVCVVSSLGAKKYLSALKSAKFIMGNSSSGLSEGPYFRIPTINIGCRQQGRITPESVIHCEPQEEAIYQAVKTALSQEFAKRVAQMEYPWGDGYAAEKTAAAIRSFFDCSQVDDRKKFYDLPVQA